MTLKRLDERKSWRFFLHSTQSGVAESTISIHVIFPQQWRPAHHRGPCSALHGRSQSAASTLWASGIYSWSPEKSARPSQESTVHLCSCAFSLRVDSHIIGVELNSHPGELTMAYRKVRTHILSKDGLYTGVQELG